MIALIIYALTTFSLMLIGFKFINDFGIDDKKKMWLATDIAGIVSMFWFPCLIMFAVWLMFVKNDEKVEEKSENLQEKFSRAFE